MIAPDHDRIRELTAAYVVGALGPDDRIELEAHLAGCDTCRQDVIDFAPLPALLGRVDPGELVDHQPPVPGVDALVAAVHGDVAHVERSRTRWRRAAGAIAVAAGLVLGVVLFVEDGARDRREGVALSLTAAPAGASVRVVADERPWGTYVHVSASGLPARSSYAVWAVDADGSWEPMGSWAPTPDGSAELGCSTALPLGELDRVVVTSSDRDDELLVAAASS
ncbi:MAG TPA: zf-HC2 domain-containing protein [Acidimicrobiales bacterium]|nr:zf-HC2 domain-containing protein [Acidimicrobiales bacterium]